MKLEDIKIAKLYASIIFDIALKQGDIDIIIGQIKLLNDVIAANVEFTKIINCPIINLDKKYSLIAKISSNDSPKFIVSFLNLVIKNKRFYLLPEIIKEFFNLYNELKKQKDVTVTASRKLSNKELEYISSLLKDKYDYSFNIKTKINKNTLGGIVIEIDNKVLDLSLSGYLDFLKKRAESVLASLSITS